VKLGQSQQKLLYKIICGLFMPHEVVYNARKETGLVKYQERRVSYHEVDIWIPTLKLGFEMQDPSHYTSTYYANVPLHIVQSRDADKKLAMLEKNYTLIEIPCWWDGTSESLVSTIKKIRPDLLLSEFGKLIYIYCACSLNHNTTVTSECIPDVPPCDYFDALSIPHVGELMLASFAPKNTDFVGWWMGEKFDGIRACWNPNSKIIYSRMANKLISSHSNKLWLGSVPHDSHFINAMPTAFLDCELWAGRGNFMATKILTSTNSGEQLPPSLRMIAFDEPSFDFHHLPFEKRPIQTAN
jgi:hypothetical protein